MPAQLRRAVPGDLEALVRLENLVFQSDRISRRSFKAFLAGDTDDTLIAHHDGVIIGYAIVLYRAKTAVARLYSIAIDPASAGRGIGAMLLEAAENAAFERDRIILRLEVREDNARAIQLYEREGFHKFARQPDYYEDGAAALRFEKRLRGDTDSAPAVPYYEQSEDFTCGPSCLLMAMAHYLPQFTPSPIMEIRLWREATTVFMLSGPGGCEPYGLAVAAAEHGLSAEIVVSIDGPLFLQSVRSEEKRRVMVLTQEDFRNRAAKCGIHAAIRGFTLDDMRDAVAAGKLVIVLITGYHMFGKKVPHWVLVIGDDGRHLIIHDPWVEDEAGETPAEAARVPIPYQPFMAMARFGRDGLRAAVILGRKA
jgi:ribosomal-protein-alanine acetyltransferase